MTRYVIPLNQLGRHDVETVGGKNSSLGEMLRELTRLGIQVPDGFATTAEAYREFLNQGGLATRIHTRLAALDVDDVGELARVGAAIRDETRAISLPQQLQNEVLVSWRAMDGGKGVAVAVRSSATAEDLPKPPSQASRDFSQRAG
jgi:pyruvate,water dikinase